MNYKNTSTEKLQRALKDALDQKEVIGCEVRLAAKTGDIRYYKSACNRSLSNAQKINNIENELKFRAFAEASKHD